jgi:hypothetical protein
MTSAVASCVTTRSAEPRRFAAISAASLPVFAAGLLGACSSSPDPCGDAATCVRVDVDSFTIETIDQLELDLVYRSVHATTTIGDPGSALNLPVSTAIVLDLSGALIDLDVVAAGRLDGAVLGAAAASAMVQQGQRTSITLHLTPFNRCFEGELYCGGVSPILADFLSLYRCTNGVPLHYARCSSGCTPYQRTNGVCAGTGICRDGGRYCGGHVLDGDPFTLYVCEDLRGIEPRKCAGACLVQGDGDDTCQ